MGDDVDRAAVAEAASRLGITSEAVSIIMSLTQRRISELEPPSEPREGHEKASETADKGEEPAQDRRPWWAFWR
jgi:hypothetical protein